MTQSMLQFRDIGLNRIEAVYGQHETAIGMIIAHDDGGCAWCFRLNSIVVDFRRAYSITIAKEEILRCFCEAFGAPQLSQREQVSA